MKYVLFLSILISSSVWADSIKDFNKALNQDLKSDIKKDDEKFKRPASRGPASVEPSAPTQIEEVPKIDKNVRQIGPNEW